MTKTVLVVEDDDDQRMLYREALTDEGYDVLEASSGRAGIAAAGQSHPDVVVLDINIPDMDGLEVLRRLVSQHPPAHVILNTAHPLYQDSPVSTAADAYVLKSGDLTPLKNQIRKVVEATPAITARATTAKE